MSDGKTDNLLLDIAAGALGGLVGTWLMPKVAKPLFKLESDEKKAREKQLRDEPTYQVLADRIDRWLDLELSVDDRKRLGAAVHWSYGVGWGALYGVLRRRAPSLAKGFGLPFAVGFTLIGDEAVNTILELTPPPREFPLETHARGLAAHIVFTAGAEMTARGVERLMGHRVTSPGP